MGMEYEVWMVAFEIDHSHSGRKPVLNDALASLFFLINKPLRVQF